MKTFLKVLGLILLIVGTLRVIQLTADYVYRHYGKRYVSCDIDDFN